MRLGGAGFRVSGPLLTALALATAAATLSAPRLALAGDTARKPSTAELRESEQQLESRREFALRRVEEHLRDQTIDADDAVMERTKIDREYKAELGALLQQEKSAAQDRGRRPSPGDGEAAAGNPRVASLPFTIDRDLSAGRHAPRRRRLRSPNPTAVKKMSASGRTRAAVLTPPHARFGRFPHATPSATPIPDRFRCQFSTSFR